MRRETLASGRRGKAVLGALLLAVTVAGRASAVLLPALAVVLAGFGPLQAGPARCV